MQVCNTNTLCCTDYGIPITAAKSTDYRTFTANSYRYTPIPEPQFTECRTKANLKPEQLKYDVTIRDDTFQTTFRNSFTVKQAGGGPLDHMPTAQYLFNVHYIRTIQEKIFKNPPPPRPFKLSEMKDSYRLKERPEEFILHPPEPYAKCEIKALGRDEVPPIHPEEKGYFRHLDPYVSTNRASYVQYSKDQQNGIARKDIVTYYDASGVPKGGKGYGPKTPPAVEPLLSIRKTPVYDKVVFNLKFMDRRVPNTMKRVPHTGIKTEYQGNYYAKTESDFYPYIFQCGEEFKESNAAAGAWQNLPAPAMYCTEYCHLGTGWPVSAVVEPKKSSDVDKAMSDPCAPKIRCY